MTVSNRFLNIDVFIQFFCTVSMSSIPRSLQSTYKHVPDLWPTRQSVHVYSTVLYTFTVKTRILPLSGKRYPQVYPRLSAVCVN